MEFDVVGKDIKRTDALKKVTGTLDYVIDQKMQGMLYGKLLRSEHAHAKIVNVDASAAKEIPGVYDVITSTDLPQPVPRFGPIKQDQPLLADRVVNYHGEPVAVVLADSEETAHKALKKIKVEYEKLPSVSKLDDALRADAPIVNPDSIGMYEELGSNICGNWKFGWGDVEAKNHVASFMLKNVYEFPMIHHFPIEPFSCICYPENGGVAIRSPIQHPFILRRVVAKALNMELSQVRVIGNAIGGGFGGKGYPKIEPLTAYLALHTGKPVKIVLSLEEGFFSARRSSSRVTMNTGFDLEGKIQFQDVKVEFLVGAYADTAPRVASKSSYLGCGPYVTPNARIDCRAVYSHTVPSTAFRGFGMPQIVWAVESQMNEASKVLGIDPLEIRLRNLPKKGEILVPGDRPVDGDWEQGLRKAAETIGWGTEKPDGIGRGIAIGIKNPIPASLSKSIVKLHADGSVTVSVGTSEMGQGARTTMGQIAAEALGVPMERVTLIMADTAAVPFDTATAGSRSTVAMGNAVVSACHDIKEQLTEMAHELFADGSQEEVVISRGTIEAYGKSFSYADILAEYFGPNMGEVVGNGTYKGSKIEGHPVGGMADFWEIVFTAAEVSVDKESGKVYTNKLVNVSDVGCIINPLQAEAQEEGAAIMGMGHTFMEQMVYDDSGRLVNGGALDYRVPTIKDIPAEFISKFIENRDGAGPFGAKGIGESGIIAIAPAVAAAVNDTLGIRFRQLPLSAENVWKELHRESK